MSSSILYAVLMLVAGIGIPIMATLNAGLGSQLHSPISAVIILVSVALLLSVGLSVLIGGTGFKGIASVNWYFYLGGALFVLYILSVSWVIPRFGVANAIAFVLVGQLLAMSVIDHFGLFGTQVFPMSLKRVVGLVLMGLGAALVLSKPQIA